MSRRPGTRGLVVLHARRLSPRTRFWLGLLLIVGPACTPPAGRPAARPSAPFPVQVAEIQRWIDGQPIRGWVARVDLSDPRVEIRVTAPPDLRADAPPGTEVYAETTPAWLEREGLVLAVNTHFFARVGDDKSSLAPGTPLDLIGPCVSDGRVVSPAPATQPCPVLALDPHRRGRVAVLARDDLVGMDDVVSGSPGTGTSRGGLLVEDGRNVGLEARPQPEKRHPRTAAGLTADGATLLLVVIDGRQPGWSVGMTLVELADLMIELGADDAVNLDGGGSSSFVFAPPDGPRIENRPSDGRWRPVGASLGVRVTK